MNVHSIGLIVEDVVRWDSLPWKDVPMNIGFAQPQSQKQSLGSVMLSALGNLVAAVTDRASTDKAAPRPYSFLSECECPYDCLRDHENE
jgi:hypothetical protein